MLSEQRVVRRHGSVGRGQYTSHQGRYQHGTDDNGGGAGVETDRRNDHSADKHAHVSPSDLPAVKEPQSYLLV